MTLSHHLQLRKSSTSHMRSLTERATEESLHQALVPGARRCPLLILLGLCCVFFLPSYAKPIYAKEQADPHLWLEEVTGSEAIAWVKRQNHATIELLTKSDSFHDLEKRLREIYDSTERIPYVAKAGSYYYNFWRDASHPRGLWRRATLDQYRQEDPPWEIVLDLDALANEENENWVWKGAQFLEPECTRCLLQLSRGGADATAVREFDVETKSFVESGFVLPEAKSDANWHDVDRLLVATDFGPKSLTSSGYPRQVKLWKRGTPLKEATEVFSGKADDVRVYAFRDFTRSFQRDFVVRSPTFWTSERFLLREGRLVKIDKPDDARITVWRQWLLLWLRSDWVLAGTTYPAGALLAIDFDAFQRGDRGFDVLFRPTERTSLAGLSPTRHHVILNELDNVRSRIAVLTPDKDGWKRQPLPGIAKLSTASAHAVDSNDSDDYFLSATGYLTPPRLSLGTAGKGPAEMLKQTPAFFQAKSLVVTQHNAVSKDGTSIPYFQIANQQLTPSGNHRTLLYGYGGFEISLVPGYRAATGAAWLEKGGVYVVANIRGGGEFGPAWHQAALKENRPRAYEDFIAVAEDLIRRNITSSQHLGIMGGSNGGLLIGNVVNLRPDLFGAAVCQVPLLDMRRYHKLLAGASWMAEYGNPDVPEQWDYIRTFSPYHNVKKETKYPRVLFTTSTRDDRVHPGHARKMVARMQSMGHDVLYYENIEGGHGGAANNKQRAFMSALAYTFLWEQLGDSTQ